MLYTNRHNLTFPSSPLLIQAHPPHSWALPPAGSITSVAVLTSGQSSNTLTSSTATSITASPVLAGQHNPWQLPTPTFAQSPPPPQYPPQSAYPQIPPGGPNSQPGLILSPAADPIPSNMVQRIRTGQFVEMRDLLADNISLLHQVSAFQGQLPFSFGPSTRP